MRKSLLNSNKSKFHFVAMAVASAALTGFGAAVRADTIAEWTFETNPSRLIGAPGTNTAFTGTGGAISADVGTGTASAKHTGNATYSAPSGNGSLASFSANVWAVGDYFEFDVTTTGFTGITLTFDQTGSATGPKNFKIETSNDNGGSWVDLASSAYNVANTTGTTTSVSSTNTVTISTSIAWGTASTASNAASALSFDLSSISNLTGIRIVDNGTGALGTSSAVGSGGTDRVDNVLFTGTSAAPEPASAAALAGGAAFLLGRRRNRK